MGTNIKPYRCTHPGCNFRSRQKSHLTVHLRTHTGLKPFTCPWKGCRYRCNQKGDLTRHLKSKHPTEWLAGHRGKFEGSNLDDDDDQGLSTITTDALDDKNDGGQEKEKNKDVDDTMAGIESGSDLKFLEESSMTSTPPTSPASPIHSISFPSATITPPRHSVQPQHIQRAAFRVGNNGMNIGVERRTMRSVSVPSVTMGQHHASSRRRRTASASAAVATGSIPGKLSFNVFPAQIRDKLHPLFSANRTTASNTAERLLALVSLQQQQQCQQLQQPPFVSNYPHANMQRRLSGDGCSMINPTPPMSPPSSPLGQLKKGNTISSMGRTANAEALNRTSINMNVTRTLPHLMPNHQNTTTVCRYALL